MNRHFIPDGVRAFAGARDGFERVARAHPHRVRELFCDFGGRTVRLRVVGPRLAEAIQRPLAHLRIDGASRDLGLTIDLWDDAEESEPALRDAMLPADAPSVLASGDGRVIAYRIPGSTTWLDRRARSIVGCCSGTNLDLHQSAHPLCPLLAIWYADRGMPVLHGALVARDGRGILFGGRGGTGKSTAALACVEGGSSYLGDDYIALASDAASWVGHSLYCSLLFDSDHADSFASLRTYIIPCARRARARTAFDLWRAFPGQLARSASIRAVVLPQVVSAAGSRLLPASKGDALLALAPSAIFRVRSTAADRSFDLITRFVQAAPVYRLEMGADRERTSVLVDDLLADLCGALPR